MTKFCFCCLGIPTTALQSPITVNTARSSCPTSEVMALWDACASSTKTYYATVLGWLYDDCPLSNFPTQSTKTNCFHKSWWSLSRPFESLYQAWTRCSQAQFSRKTRCQEQPSGSNAYQIKEVSHTRERHWWPWKLVPFFLHQENRPKQNLWGWRRSIQWYMEQVAGQLPAQSSHELGSHGWRQYTSW